MTRPRTMQLLLAIVVASTLITPFTRELFVGDETKYSEVVREMRATGAFFLPTLEGTPFTHKPPLHFWTIDLLTYVFGTYSMWSYVLPSLVSFVLLLWLMWKMGGPLAAFICGTSLMVWGSAQTARMDVGFTALIALGVHYLERFLNHRDTEALWQCGVAIGIATLLKGPMAIVIVVVLLALECWRRHTLPRGSYSLAIAAMALIPLLWFVPAMLLGGGTYTHEVLQKQLAGRAVASWVHQSPPWYYLLHSPAILFPWFFPAVAAIVFRWREQRFNVNWILAVLVPYSLMSSKLDVYMMALIPPVALIVADYVEHANVWLRRTNAATLVLLVLIGVAAFFLVTPARLKGPEAALAASISVKALFVILAIAAFAALWFIKSNHGGTEGVGFVPLVVFVYAAIALMPQINELASTRPLVRELARLGVPGDRIALFTSPHLWTHDMPRDLERVHYAGAQSAFATNPEIVVTSRRYASQLGTPLARYRKVAELRMIGKWFDVYRQ